MPVILQFIIGAGVFALIVWLCVEWKETVDIMEGRDPKKKNDKGWW